VLDWGHEDESIMSVDAASWRNRIVRSGDAALAEITANPANWRTHPKHQADALSGVLDAVGYVQQVVINARSGRLVDGHLRVELAERHGETSVPAVWVDLSDDEEALILATLDPLGALAGRDDAALRSLLRSVSTSDDALAAMLAELAPAVVVEPTPPESFAEYGDDLPTEYACPRCAYVWSGQARPT
jgi:hypothetical protein